MRGLLNYNIACFQADNNFSFPLLFPVKEKVDCSKWIDFDSACTHTGQANGVHFYISDYKFNRIWENPRKYINLLSHFNYVVQPDFSLYFDFPVALQIYNKFRNHWLAAYFGVNGVPMIPNVRPSIPECWDWSFDGLPSGSVVAFSDVGAVRDKESRKILHKSYDEMLRRLSPFQILYFTRSPANAPSETDVVVLPFIKNK